MAQITFDAAAITSAATSLKKTNENMNNTLTSVFTKVNSLDSGWDGGASEAALTRFRNFQKKFPTIKSDIDKYVQFLNNAVTSYTQTETSVQNKATSQTTSIDFFKK